MLSFASRCAETPWRGHDVRHFASMFGRYLDTTLAAYVGEDVVVRYDPRDIAELRVYFQDGFVCRAINPELTGETIALKDIIRARNLRRRELQTTLTERRALVDSLLDMLPVNSKYRSRWRPTRRRRRHKQNGLV